MAAKFKIASTVALAGLVAFTAVPAIAADMIESAPEAPAPVYEEPVSTWTGGYGGVNLGGGFGGRARDKRADNKVDTSGISGSLFGGYQQDLGNGVVLGGEAEAGYSGVKGSNAGTKVKTGVDGSARLRAGYAVTPNVLPYATGGVAARKLSVTEAGRKDSDTQIGWTAGAGVDVKLTSKVFARGEYRYSDYGSDSFTTGSGTRKVDSTDHRATLGLGVQF